MLKKIIYFGTFFLFALLLLFSCSQFRNKELINPIHGAWEQTDDFNIYYFINNDSILIEGISSISIITHDLSKGANSNFLSARITIIDDDSIQLLIDKNKTVTLRRISDTVIIPTTERGMFNIDTVNNLRCLGYRYNGKQHGIWVCTNGNDEIKTLTRWYDGKKNGVELRYSHDSTIASKSFYRNNVLLHSSD